MDSYHYLSFSSAGTKGVAYVGVLDAFEDHLGEGYDDWRAGIRGVAGCSSGSIVGLMFVLGLNKKKRQELLFTFDMHTVLRDPDLAMLWQQYGIAEGAGLREITQEVLNQGGLSIHSTFRDLRRLLRVDFVCVASDLMTASATFFSASNTPDVRIADAIGASCCVPIAFKPHTIDGRTYVDGCLTCDCPDVFQHDQTLFVTVSTSNLPSPPDTWISYLNALMRCATHTQSICVSERACISVHLDDDQGFDVQMDDAKKLRTLHRGFVDALGFMTGGALLRACSIACGLYLRACHTSHLKVDDESPPATREAGDAASQCTAAPG